VIAMSSSARNFGALAHYLATGRSGDHPERVAWSASRNLPTDDPEVAGKIMRATAAQNVRVKQSIYHLALSFDKNDAVDRITMERVADRVLDALDLKGHQVLIVSHRDRDHPHMHLLINRVHPDTGLVWNRWQDRTVLQRVLRDEEQALGLRVVPGRLSAVEPTTQDRADTNTRKTSDRQNEGRSPPEPSNLNLSADRARSSRVVEIKNHLQAYERFDELSHERYQIEVDATSMRARMATLGQSAEHASRANESFDAALGRVYRTPQLARDHFTTAAEQLGIAQATRTMHERPEKFGALLSIEQTRAFGLARTTDDRNAREAAILAARAGHLAWEAGNALRVEVAQARATRTEDEIWVAIRALYDNPVRARAAFDHLIAEHGAAEALRRIREPGDEFGCMRAAVRDDPVRIASHVETLTRAALKSEPGREPLTATSPVVDARLELLAISATTQELSERESTIGRDMKRVPDRGDLERRIVGLLERLSPTEVRRLQSLLTPPQLVIAARLKGTLRDALLGREDTPER
jgi:hypothetical protein